MEGEEVTEVTINGKAISAISNLTVPNSSPSDDEKEYFEAEVTDYLRAFNDSNNKL